MDELKSLNDWIHSLGYEFYGKREVLIKGMFDRGSAIEAIDKLVSQGLVKKSAD